MTHYETLGVVEGASSAEIHAAYKRLARRVHPDAGGDERRMAAVNEAYRVLSDAGRRSRYDAAQRRSVAAPPAPDAIDDGRLPDDEDDADFVPMARWQRRLPIWAILVLGTLFAVFLVTAYASSGRGTPTTTLPPVDGTLQLGSCVREDAGGVVAEIPCGGRRDGVVMSLIRPGEQCPPATERLRRADATGEACVRRM